MSDVRVAFSFLGDFGLGESDGRTTATPYWVRFSKPGGAILYVGLDPREGSHWTLGHADVVDRVYPGELLALNGWTMHRYVRHLERSRPLRDRLHSDPASVQAQTLSSLAAVLRDFGGEILNDDLATFDRLVELRRVGINEWIRLHVPL